MLRRIVRGSIRRLKNWLDDEPEDWRAKYEETGFMYAQLNSILASMVREGFRQSYAWGVLQGINLAQAMGVQRVSVIEFGVAGGNGQVALERIAERIATLFPIRIDIYGFDSGAGFPAPVDHRDVPNLASAGLYAMNREQLEKRLRGARLVLGPIEDTLGAFLSSAPAPIAFVACDLVLYTSTIHALRVLDADHKLLLPRIHWYCDDVLGFTFGDHNGERLAISEFNAAHEMRKLSPVYGLRYYVPARCANEMWVEKFWIAHIFDHPLYGQRDNLVRRHDLNLRPERE